MKKRKTILFICTHNSARSQMAEGFVNHMFGERFRAFSAGTQPGRVNPHAVTVLRELGIDIGSARSKSTGEFLGEKIDMVVTVCDQAKESCPFFPGAQFYLHKSFKDPSTAVGTEEEILAEFRRTRDEIRAWLVEYFRESEG